ncbi:MAG: YnfA family protein [Cryomorphaceae bacterium]
MNILEVTRSLSLFALAGLLEIGGGYLVWLSLRSEKPWWFGLLGGVALVLYGIVATWQPANFGRVYAAYGGVFIVMAILWGWKVDGIAPDRYDLIGGFVALVGVLIIMYAPRAS